MFKCYDCGREFEEPKTWTESHRETFSSCPSCGGSYDEAQRCDYCCGYYLESERCGICQDCIDELKSRYQKVLSENFTKYEIEVLELIV